VSTAWQVVRLLVGYPGYLHKVRGALLAMSVFVVTFAGLAVAAAPGASAFRHQREHDLTPAATTASRATFDFAVTGSDRLWAGRRVTRVFLAPHDGRRPDAPPGVPSFPGEGEAFVSPHLREQMRSDPLLRSLLGPARIVGIITPDGLSEPDENRAIIGLPATSAPRLTPAASWGAPPMAAPSEARVMIVLGLFLGLLVLVPAAALAAITARLGETERGDRAAVLRMLGAPQTLAAQVSAAEVALVGLPASAASVASFAWLAAGSVRVPVVDLTVFADAIHVAWPLQLAIALFAVGAHAAVAACISARGRATLQPLLATQPLRLRSLWLFAVGLLILVGLALATTLPPAVAGVAFFIGAAALALSLATALPTATRWLAGRTAHRARRGGTLYGLRLLAERSLPSTRIAALIALLIVALGTAVPFLAILNGGGAHGLGEYAARHPRTVVSVFDSGLDVTRTSSLVPDAVVKPIFTAQGDTGEGVTVLAATCGEATELLSTPLPDCPDEPVWLSDETTLAPTRLSSLAMVAGSMPVPPTSSALQVSGLPGELGGLLLVPPTIARRLATDPSSSGAVASIPTAAVDRYLAAVSAVAPWAQTRTDSLEASNPDQRLYPGTSRLIVLAAWTSLVLATLSLLAASLGEVAAQRRRSRELDVLGAGTADFARLHLTTTAAPLAAAGGLATVVSVLIGRALIHLDDRAIASPAMYLAMAAGTALVSALTTAVTAPLMRSTRP
jgi:hypothetical protein